MMLKTQTLLLFTITILSIGSLSSKGSVNNKDLNLSGSWTVKLDSLDKGISEEWYTKKMMTDGQVIDLPSTLDRSFIGDRQNYDIKLDKNTLYQLSRTFKYIGAAWYQKEIEIPNSYKNKNLTIKMERVLWKSTVWIDGLGMGSANSLVGSHEIKLGKLKPGKHLITICIDNRQQFDIFDNSKELPLAHSFTETTQTIWNGILGDFKIIANEEMSVSNLKLTPDIKNNRILIQAKVNNPTNDNLILELNDADGKLLSKKNIKTSNDLLANFTYPFELWDEHNPVLYNLAIKNKSGIILQESDFGMRELNNHENVMLINGKRLFLRGTLECCIFPLTGHPPMDDAGWEKVFQSAKDYGLNHLRFHSWCPPEAAFKVADRMGFYLQIEMPNWSLKYGADTAMVNWMESEGRKMISDYGNHPSFCFMSLGNELEGDYSLLDKFLKELRALDQRHLYTVTSFTFQKPYSIEPDGNNQFWITQWTKNGWVRGQGVFDDNPPTFNKNYRSSIEFLKLPLITHEIGQYSVFPNLKEIDKYTGVLKPNNFIAIKNDLKLKGRLEMSEMYMKASGQLAKILYKEEVERALKTPGISGFQLLDLHDFPGQGTALVGMLDAFWDSKGIIDGKSFRQFCSELVPLLSFEKAAYKNSETFNAIAEVANYHQTLNNAKFDWKITMNNQTIENGNFIISEIKQGEFANLGNISYNLSKIDEPVQLEISLGLTGTEYQNKWNIWVYPDNPNINLENVIVTSSWEEASVELEKGKKVLFSPDLNQVNGIEGKFVPVFWSPVHFPNQPGSMGLLVNEKHAAFSRFPTSYHSDWQWWDLCKQSKSLNIEGISVQPLIVVVDNFFKNRNLSNLFEVKVGKGSLLFSGIDIHSNLEERIEAKALFVSLVHYMNSIHFSPTHSMNFEKIIDLFKTNDSSIKTDKKSIYEN